MRLTAPAAMAMGRTTGAATVASALTPKALAPKASAFGVSAHRSTRTSGNGAAGGAHFVRAGEGAREFFSGDAGIDGLCNGHGVAPVFVDGGCQQQRGWR